MESKVKDCLEQYDEYCSKVRENTLSSEELKKIFKHIYGFNYLRNRIEVRDLFDNSYFKYSYSALLESFDLLSNNYTRASLLVLRSSIESFQKFIIDCFINKGNNLKIHDKVYNQNKKTIDRIINNKIDKNFQSELISANSKLETIYGNISGISHSISKDIDFFSEYLEDLTIIKNEDIDKVIIIMTDVIRSYYIFCIGLCQESFYNWNTEDLNIMFQFIYGKRRIESIIKKIKGTTN